MRIDPRGGPAYTQVAGHLRQRIVDGDLVPGDQLPTEAEMTGLYEVSRSTVREALRVLASENLVETVRGVTGGTFVAVPDVERISRVIATNLGQLALTHDVDVDELLLARELLEVPAARLAAERRTDADLDGFREWLVDPATLTREERFEANRNFHEAVVGATGSSLLDLLTQPLFIVLRQRFLRDRAPSEFWTDVDTDHRRIADAIARGDGDAAATAMHDHLQSLRATYELLEQQAGET